METWEDNSVIEKESETTVVKVKKTIQVPVRRVEHKTRVVVQPVQRQIRESTCFGSEWRTITEYQSVNQPYVETFTDMVSTTIEEPQIRITPKDVRRNYARKVMKKVPVTGINVKKRTEMRQVEVKFTRPKIETILTGVRTVTIELHQEGMQYKGWDVGAAWGEPVWLHEKSIPIEESFEPAPGGVALTGSDIP
jgi:hypothetical protein